MLTETTAPGVLPIALLGADALLAARPATPVQVLHACAAAGFAAAFPVSWGDELVSRECLARLSKSEAPHAVLCACPHAAREILEHEIPGAALTLASPPVAAARLVRGAYHGQPVRITYVGGCPSGADPAIDAHVSPSAFLSTLEERGIVLSDQPETFEGVLPPDRRRFFSTPGGCPDRDRLAEVGYRLVEWRPGMETPPPDERVLFDVSAAAGCACTGAPHGGDEVATLEPPRATHAIIDPIVAVDMSPGPIVEATALARRNMLAYDAPPAPPPVAAESGAPQETVPVGSEEPPQARSHIPGPRGFNPSESPARPGVAQLRSPVFEFRRPIIPRSGVVFEEIPRRRRITLASLLLAIALGASLPLAAYGVWAFFHGRPSFLTNRESSPAAIEDTARTSGSPLTAPSNSVDSAAGVTVVDSASRGDSIVAQSAPTAKVADSATSVRPESTTAVRPDSMAAATPETAKTNRPRCCRTLLPTTPAGRAGGAARDVKKAARPPAPAADTSAAHRVQTAVDSAIPTRSESSSTELDSLLREIARRRARMDSLNRFLDSLRRLQKRPPPLH